MPPLSLPAIGWFGGYYDPAHFRRCSHFVGVTPDIVEHIVACGVPRAKAHHVPTFPVLEPGPPVDRASLATPADASVLLTLSRLHAKKGLDVLLDAVAELPRCTAWIAGDGPLEKDLKARGAALGIADRVRFLGWRRDRGALLAAADVCVLPSRWEPFGTVMLEAWAAGIPLVAAASQGPAALIADGSNGLLVPVDDAPALATAIGRVLADPALRARLIERGRTDYQLGFTREAVTQRMIALYTKIATERSAGSGATEGEERA
jgi:glycosyltransferase involved in cell wall biosynthesis